MTETRHGERNIRWFNAGNAVKFYYHVFLLRLDTFYRDTHVVSCFWEMPVRWSTCRFLLSDAWSRSRWSTSRVSFQVFQHLLLEIRPVYSAPSCFNRAWIFLCYIFPWLVTRSGLERYGGGILIVVVCRARQENLELTKQLRLLRFYRWILLGLILCSVNASVSLDSVAFFSTCTVHFYISSTY